MVFVTGLAMALLWLVIPSDVSAGQDGPILLASNAEYSFGQAMQFSLQAQSKAAIKNVTLSIQPADLPNTLTAEVAVTPDEEVTATYVVDLTQFRLAPFTTVLYWWHVEDEAGGTLETEPQLLEYIDDRFRWQTNEQDGIEISWTGEDPTTGQVVKDAIAGALPLIEAIVPISRPSPLRIYVYPSAADLRAALRLTGREWVGAHAHPELGVILVAANEPLSPSTELARSVAHELAHLYLFQVTGARYETAPLWLDEGIASMVEGATENSTYSTRLAEALEGAQTIAFADLCYSLPANEDQALLAYAQSASFVIYLQTEYGTQALQRIIAEVAGGSDCQAAPLGALGKSLAQLNEDWLEREMPKSTLERVWTAGRAWFILIAAGFFLAGLLAIVPRATRR